MSARADGAGRRRGIGLSLAPLIALAASGCAQPEVIDLHNIRTGQFVRCELPGESSSLPGSFFRSTSSRACPADLADAGWQRVR